MTATSVRSVVSESVAALDAAASHGDSAMRRREAELLLEHVLDVDRAWLFAHADDVVSAAAAQTLRQLVARRARGEPIAYITGRREFYSLDLTVTPDVLIPRAETELLVDTALEKLRGLDAPTVVDLGTGSGAIALAIANQLAQAQVIAVDASRAALEVARGNARRLGLHNLEFLHGDWCQPLGKRRVELIVSNPPYVAVGDAHLLRGDLRFEPAAALSSGADGLDAIRRIARDVRSHLNPGGWLLFEHGHDQGAAVREILLNHAFGQVSTLPDLEARDRVSIGRFVDAAN